MFVKVKLGFIMHIILCTAYFLTHVPVKSPSLFEFDNIAPNYADEAYVIYLTHQFKFSEKNQVSDLTVIITG